MFKFKRKVVEINQKFTNLFGDIAVANLYIKEEDDNFIYFEVAYPGLTLDDIAISVKDNFMWLIVHTVNEESDYRKYWSVKRMKAIYDFNGYDVDLNNIESEFKNCILTIKVKKVKKEVVRKRFKVGK